MSGKTKSVKSIGRERVLHFFFLCVHLTNFADGGILTVPPLIVQLVLLGGGGKNVRKETTWY